MYHSNGRLRAAKAVSIDPAVNLVVLTIAAIRSSITLPEIAAVFVAILIFELRRAALFITRTTIGHRGRIIFVISLITATVALACRRSLAVRTVPVDLSTCECSLDAA